MPVWWGIGGYLMRSMQPAGGPFLAWIRHPIPSVPLQLANTLPVPDLRVYLLPNIPLRCLYSLATPLITHSLCPKGKGQATAPCYMLRRCIVHCVCVCAPPATGSRHGCLFSS